MYPNPVKGKLYIESALVIEQAVFYDIWGRERLRKELIDNTISVEELPEGMYFLQLESEEKIVDLQKIVVQH